MPLLSVTNNQRSSPFASAVHVLSIIIIPTLFMIHPSPHGGDNRSRKLDDRLF
jgi:hypothetical protein